MTWLPLVEEKQLDDITLASHTKPIVIFKHSTRCSISSVALARMERGPAPDSVDFYYLDLLKFRNISHLIAERFQVHHESPQLLLIKNGECVYDESHSGINMAELTEQVL